MTTARSYSKVGKSARAHREKRPEMYCPGDRGRCLFKTHDKDGRFTGACTKHPRLSWDAAMQRMLNDLRAEQRDEPGNTDVEGIGACAFHAEPLDENEECQKCRQDALEDCALSDDAWTDYDRREASRPDDGFDL